jgi:hypothetical protein
MRNDNGFQGSSYRFGDRSGIGEGLVRNLAFFVVDLGSRRVHIAGVAIDPDGTWVTQLARNLTDPGHGFLRGKRYLIHDRDPLYVQSFDTALDAAGLQSVRLPGAKSEPQRLCGAFPDGRSVRSAWIASS